MLETTLNKIRNCNPCEEGWDELLAFLGKTKADDEPLPLLTILESNGVTDALWALRAIEGLDGPIRLFACACAYGGLYLFERKHADDLRPRRAIETAERFARGQATHRELQDAEVVAWRVVKAYSGNPSSAVLAKSIVWVTFPYAAAAAYLVRTIEEYQVEEFKRLCILGSEYDQV